MQIPRRWQQRPTALRDALWVLGLDTLDPGADAADIPAALAELAAARERARTGRDFAEADRLRDEIARHGYVVRDTPQGPELVPRDAAT